MCQKNCGVSVRVCRVNELVQLASTRLTAEPVTANEESSECLVAGVCDGNQQTWKSTNTSPTQPNNFTSRRSDDLSSTNRRNSTSPPSSVDNNATVSVTSSATVTETRLHTLQNCVDVSASTENILRNEEAALTSTCITEPEPAVLAHLAVQTSSDNLPLCAADTEYSESVPVSSVNSANSAGLHVSSVKLSTIDLSSVKDSSPVETSVSSTVIESHPASATDAAPSNDVVVQTSSAVSNVSPVTVLTHNAVSNVSPVDVLTRSAVSNVSPVDVSTHTAGDLMPTRSSELPKISISTEMEREDKLTSAAGSTMVASSPAAECRNIPTKELKLPAKEQKHTAEISKSSGLTTSVSVNSDIRSAMAPEGCTSAMLNNAVSLLTSLMQQKKSKCIEPADKTILASISRKRPYKLSSATVPDTAEPEEKPSKRTKLDEPVAKLDEPLPSSSTAAQPPAGNTNKDVSSAVTMTGLTDTERVSCYKTIGAREERERLSGLRTAERLHRKTALAEKSAVVNAVDSSKSDTPVVSGSTDESNISRSSSSPKKPARRVPLVTVSAQLPVTPTLFTLRSRARLAQLEQKTMMPNVSLDSVEMPSVSLDSKESQRRTAQTGSQEKNTAQTDVDDGFKHTETLKAARSANCDEPDGGKSVVSDLRESATTDTVQPRGPHDVPGNQKHNLQNCRSGHQPRSSRKPNSDITSSTESAADACRVETSKPRYAATADVNDKLNLSGKPSKPTSASVTDKNTSSGIKAPAVVTSKPNNNKNVADSHSKATVTGAGKRQSSIGTRSSTRKCDKSDSSKSDSTKTVTGRNVQDNPRNNLPSREQSSVKGGHDKDISNTKAVSHRSLGKNAVSSRNKSEPVKPVQPANENRRTLDYNKQSVPQKDSEPCTVVEVTGGKTTKDMVNGNRRNSECGNNQADSSRVISVEQLNKAKQTDVMCESSAAVMTYQSANCVDSPATSAATNKISSPVVDTNVNHAQVVRRTSKTDLRQTVLDASAEKQAWTSIKPATPSQQVSVLFESAAKTSSPTTGLSLSRRESVDLFDVAIAGTPAQYPSPDDGSYDSDLLSPLNIDIVNEGGDAAHDDDTSRFIVPDNPVAAAVDASLCGKCVLSLMFEFLISVHLKYGR